MRQKSFVLFIAFMLGIANVLVFKAFEAAVNDGTRFIWDDIFKTATNRWVVVPLAVGLSIGYGLLLRSMQQTRLVEPKLGSEMPTKSGAASSQRIGIITLVGLGSLLAGASLGPEATLMAIAGGLGLWASATFGRQKTALLLALSSVGALLVAFLGSILPVFVPLLVLLQKKQLQAATALPVLIAGAGSYATMWLFNHDVVGYGTIPVMQADFRPLDLLLALGLGIIAAGLGWLLRRLIKGFFDLIKRHDKTAHWVVSAGTLGLVVGLLYLVGGESTEFSGSQGSEMILHHVPAYGSGALIIILLAKLFVTAWSLAGGYRGGLIFPSIYIGVVVTLIVHSLFGTAGPGILVGSIAGVFSAMAGPAMALIFIVSLLPLKLAGVALAGIIGGTAGSKMLGKLSPARTPGR